MTPQQFITKWRETPLGEKQSYQLHFRDLCRMLGHPAPDGSGIAENGQPFQFEWSLKKTSGGQGFADVYYGGHFAIEYKSPGKYKDLGDAYNQLLQYRENLNNPPLLIVTDINHWEIHTNFPNSAKDVYRFKHEEIFEYQHVLIDVFFAPERLNPNRNTEKVTAEAASAFRLIADNMRQYGAEPERIAHFVTKLVFCLFAEDVRLLPPVGDTQVGIVTHTIQQALRNPSLFVKYMEDLFRAMADGGDFLLEDIPWFNGNLFEDVSVEALYDEELIELEKAAQLDWEAIEPSIFGTLFERSLDPEKRSQLGAHYTSRDDILLIVEPVLMQPLRYEWDTVQLQAAPVRERYDQARTGRARNNARNQLVDLRERILKRIRETTVLDPACGSGNFLYVSLQMLMELEKQVINHQLWDGLQMPLPAVHPRQMYGIELNPIAQALASIVVWIGYIQWRKNNGYGQAFSEPILETLQGNIVCKDAILPPPIPRPLPPPGREGEQSQSECLTRREGELNPGELANGDESPLPLYGGGGLGVGVDWPAVDVIVGNPPFLGGQRMRGELGDEYYERLTECYRGRIPGGADLVCYWHELARQQIALGHAKRAGLLATNSIRGGVNRHVLNRIKDTGDIFMAWSDRPWILDGAAVRVSMVGFDIGTQSERILDGIPVVQINTDLTATVDVASALRLAENRGVSFQGPVKVGKFDINDELAKEMLSVSNTSAVENSSVIRPYRNATDLVKLCRNFWIIDFQEMSIGQAQQYEAPFRYVENTVKPVRLRNRDRQRRENWWRLGRSGADYREAVHPLSRQIFTPRVAKHRVFVWVKKHVFPSDAVVAIAREDDYFFGVLHSRLHEVWSLRMGTSLEDRPRYTPTTTFETFPFPWPPGGEDCAHPAHARISAAAARLHRERDEWLNPPPPGPLPHKEGGGARSADMLDNPKMREGLSSPQESSLESSSPSLPVGEGAGGWGVEKWQIPPALERRMQAVARELRKNPTQAEDTLWQEIRKRRLDGRKFRRQVAIGAFVVDFYCSSERLAVEVDGPIHGEQREADRIRQELIESLGIRFVRLTNEEVESNLASSLNAIRQSFAPTPNPSPKMREGLSPPLASSREPNSPSLILGEGAGGWGLKDRTLTNLYNALAVFRKRDSMRVKPAAADFAPRLDQLHRELDQAVCAAYGWEYGVLDDEEEILRRLLALNLARAG